MIKVFNSSQEYSTYTSNGLQSGDLYYVLDDGSIHFRTNNIDSIDKVYDRQSQSTLITLLQKDDTGTFIIPNGTKNIRTSGLASSSYNEIIIPDSVASLGDYAFESCSNLTTITIPDSVTSIGNYAFYGCTSLTSVTIPDSVTTIGNQVFGWCASLANATIPNSITSLDGTFMRCTSLTSITIPDSVTSLDGTFDSCSSLTNITIPNNVTYIGNYTFYGCSSLTSIELPNSVTSIGKEGFYGCTSLTSITVNSTTPPELVNSNAFNSTNNCPILVPSESVESYKSAKNWSALAARIQAIS